MGLELEMGEPGKEKLLPALLSVLLSVWTDIILLPRNNGSLLFFIPSTLLRREGRGSRDSAS